MAAPKLGCDPSKTNCADLTLTTREMVVQANVAKEACRSHLAEVNNLRLKQSMIPGKIVYDFFAGNDELDAEEEIARQWCEVSRQYEAEMERRRSEDPGIEETEAEVAEELEATREVYRERARQIERNYWAAGGPLAGPRAAASALTETLSTVADTARETVKGGPLGFFARLRDDFFGTWGLGRDQTAEERAVGLVRLGILVVGMVAAYFVLSRLATAGVGIAERGAERSTGLVTKLMDKPLPPGTEIGF
jgi:hypothetical protein